MSTTIHRRDDPSEERARAALHRIATTLDLTDQQIAAKARILSRTTVESRRNGRTKLNLREIELLADALGVPTDLFWADEAAILRWFADEWAARDSNPEPAAGGLVVTFPGQHRYSRGRLIAAA